jgi:hypothetical protein
MGRVSRSQLFVSGAIAFLMLIVLNVVVVIQSRKLPAQQLLQHIANTAASVKDIMVGDSQMQDDMNPVAFTETCRGSGAERPAINLGLGGTKASEHCVLLEHVLARAPAAESVFYGFYDDLLTTPVPNRWQDLGGNRSFSFIFAERAAQLLFPENASARLRLRVLAKIPIYAERLGIWTRVERARRVLGEIGLPAAAASHFGRAADFAAAVPSDLPAFEASLFAAAREGRAFNRSVEELFARARDRRLAIHLIVMPVPQSHRSRFYETEAWRAYRNHVTTRAAAQYGAAFIDAADWLPDEYFIDPLHLGAEGAKIFSRKLATVACVEDARQASR